MSMYEKSRIERKFNRHNVGFMIRGKTIVGRYYVHIQNSRSLEIDKAIYNSYVLIVHVQRKK